MRASFRLVPVLCALLLAPLCMSAEEAPIPPGARELLTPDNSVLLLIDHQPQMAFGVQSHDRGAITNNVTGLAKASKTFKIPTVLTTVAAKTFSGPIFPSLREIYPDTKVFDRTSMNAWDDKGVKDTIKASGKRKLLIAGLWTEVCVVMPTLDALKEGYQVYVIADACGGTSKEAHDLAMLRMVQAGAIPVTWQQVMLEWQRDWSRQGTYEAVNNIVKEHSGAYGLGVLYAKSMFGSKGEGGTSAKEGTRGEALETKAEERAK
jgi:nicotinamidase-related amidase